MVPWWVTHISCHYKNTIKGVGEKESKRTNTNKTLGVNQEQKESYATLSLPDSIYGLTLAWVTSENFHKATGMPTHLDSIFFHWSLSSLLLWPESTAPVRGSTPTPLNSFVQPTLFRVPLPLPDTARFQVQKPFVWFRAKTYKRIVCLADHLYSVTIHNC